MSFQEKCIELRKTKHWSQEELAQRVNVSRQSVSKWESGLSTPDLDKIMKLSAIFDVSIDYLLKDEPIPEHELSGDEHFLSQEEVHQYMDDVQHKVKRIAIAVALCIFSPIPLLMLNGFHTYQVIKISGNVANGLGLGCLLLIVGIAVGMMIINGMKLDKWKSVEKDNIALSADVRNELFIQKEDYQKTFSRAIAGGVFLCIMCCVPLLMSIMFESTPAIWVISLCLLFVCVGCGVYLFIRYGSIQESYNKLLQVDDYTLAKKRDNKRLEPLAGIYWCLIVVVYLAWSFISGQWSSTWVVWPLAGISYGALVTLIKYFMNKK